jgi:AcrR family transcriptional regulator
MNNVATSKEALLDISVKLASEKGLGALNIREVAKHGGISVGCVYNYFPSKASLVAATVERIWANIFHQANQCPRPQEFHASVLWIYESIKKGLESYPSFFSIHAMSFAADEIGEGRVVMNRFLDHMKVDLLQALKEDSDVRKDIFSDSFTESDFVNFVFDNLILLSMKQASSCDFLLNLIRKVIY